MFKKGEVVWAKISGYPWWPGIVTKIQDNSYKVAFFGERSFQVLKSDKIKPWEEFFSSFTSSVKDKKKNKTFFLAVELGKSVFSGVLDEDGNENFLDYCRNYGLDPNSDALKDFLDDFDKEPSVKEKSVKVVKMTDEKKQSEIKEQVIKTNNILNIKKKRNSFSQSNDTDSLSEKRIATTSNQSSSKKEKSETNEENKKDITNEISEIEISQNIMKNELEKILEEVDGVPNLFDNIKNIDINQAKQYDEERKKILEYIEFITMIYKIPYETNLALSDLLEKISSTSK